MIKKIRTKLILLILLAGAVSFLLFRGLWLQKWDILYWLTESCPVELPFLPKPRTDLFTRIYEEAPKYRIPESEDDIEGVEAIQPFFDLADKYTAIYIYRLEDGMYLAGRAPAALVENEDANLFRMSYTMTEGITEQSTDFPLEFKNGYATVIVNCYHSTYFIFPYLIFCMAVCIFLFLFLVLYFVTRKMRIVERLKGEILEMASGNLDTPVREEGQDELGILAKELDSLRAALKERLIREQEIHKSNQELIAALSHDLRTPLTILKGYLEILRLGRNQEQQEEYIERCIRKTEDIKEMTNRMFEYALVYDEINPEKNSLEQVKISLGAVLEDLREHAEFLELAGFRTEFEGDEWIEQSMGFSIRQNTEFPMRQQKIPETENVEAWVWADEAMVKRVFNNLFSNIIKYADKKFPIRIEISTELKEGCISETTGECGRKERNREVFAVTIRNRIKAKQNHIESSRIGLKSVRKIIEFMNGDMEVREKNEEFVVKLKLEGQEIRK